MNNNEKEKKPKKEIKETTGTTSEILNIESQINIARKLHSNANESK